MKINDIKENRIFQIIICSIFGLFMLWSQAYLEKEHEEILKEIAEVLILYASRGDKDVESIEILANDGLKDMLIFCEDEVQMLVVQHLRNRGISEEELEELGYEI